MKQLIIATTFALAIGLVAAPPPPNRKGGPKPPLRRGPSPRRARSTRLPRASLRSSSPIVGRMSMGLVLLSRRRITMVSTRVVRMGRATGGARLFLR